MSHAFKKFGLSASLISDLARVLLARSDLRLLENEAVELNIVDRASEHNRAHSQKTFSRPSETAMCHPAEGQQRVRGGDQTDDSADQKEPAIQDFDRERGDRRNNDGGQTEDDENDPLAQCSCRDVATAR